MLFAPDLPAVRHVWVRGHGDSGPLRPGVVIAWQHQPIHIVTQADWVALVAEWTYDDAVRVGWVSADRLVPIWDDARAESATGSRGERVRHAWTNYGPDMWAPALVLDWRRGEGGWEARCASASHGSLNVAWAAAERVRPVTDDRQVGRAATQRPSGPGRETGPRPEG